jgi:Homeodomain-like domain
VKLVPRKLGRGGRGRPNEDTEESARTALALRDQELAKARSALHTEREERDALELALESERKQRAKLERKLARADRTERPRRGRAADAKPAGAKQGGRERSAARGGGGKRNGATPARSKAESWQAARRLAAEGFSQREIARRLELNRRTVARLVAADELPRYRRAPRGSMLDPLEPVMRSVLEERPGIGAPGMTEVLRTHGYRGSIDLVRRRLRTLRGPS